MYSGYRGTFFAHLVSFFVTISCLLYCTFNFNVRFPKVLLVLSYIFMMSNSALSLFRYGSSNGYKLRKLHVVTHSIATTGSFALTQAALHLFFKSSYSFVLSSIFNIIPLVQITYGLNYRDRAYRTDAILAMNCIFFLATAIENSCFHAISYVISYAFAYFYIGDCGYFRETEVPSIDLQQYVQCFLAFFILNIFCN